MRLIIVFALANGVARLGSRFAIVGGGQRIEYDLRNDLYASFLAFPPRFYAAHPTGDLMTRASSDVSAVKALVGFGAVSLAATAFAFAGALLAMLAVDPWLTLWALAPYPAMIVLSKRFNAVVHERSQAAQDQLGVLSAKVQEYLAGMAVVRAYTLEARATREFGRENAEYLGRSLALARSQSSFAPLMGLIAGVGTLIVLWVGGKAVVDGRLTLGALAAFNGYLAYLAWPTIALGWTLSIVRRGLTSMQRIQEIIGARLVEPEEKVGLGGAEPPRSSLRPPTVESVLADLATTGAPSIRFADVTFAYDGRPPILILDDPFASVDAAKEEEIAAKLRALAQGRTVLLMTHRLRAAQLADRVVVLDAGRVVEQGRHADLVSSGGLYARLWRIQQLEEEIARA